MNAMSVPALRFTLHSEGSSDRVLIPIIEWLLNERSQQIFQPQWADLRAAAGSPKGLGGKLRAALQLYPCELLFVHRDADGPNRRERISEIRAALDGLAHPPAVCVVPVRMQETWLLFDEQAVRAAAGNPAGREPLDLPPLERLEALPDPKKELHEALKRASQLGARRLRRFSPRRRAFRIVELIEDFSPLRALDAFRAFESELAEILAENGW